MGKLSRPGSDLAAILTSPLIRRARARASCLLRSGYERRPVETACTFDRPHPRHIRCRELQQLLATSAECHARASSDLVALRFRLARHGRQSVGAVLAQVRTQAL